MQQVDIERGLSTAEVERAKQQGLCNYDTSVATKTIPRIIRDNIFTLFNLLNFGLAACIFMVQAYKNLLFLGVVICNTIISTVQEIHAKKVVDKLSIIAASKTTAIRNGKKEIIEINEIVMNDILEFHPGNQVVTDSIIRRGSCEVDESFITGEEENVLKKEGDMLLSGSFIVSGTCICKVEHIGYDNYTAKISSDTKYIKEVLEGYGFSNLKYAVEKSKTGIYFDIDSNKPGKTVMFRADIDALSLTELSDLEYKSKNPNVAHMCGHDGHTANLLGVAAILNEMKDDFKGKVRILFQPAEEGPDPGGAYEIMQEGKVLEGVDNAFGFHTYGAGDFGKVYFKKGDLYSSFIDFKITIKSVGGHCSEPHKCADPVFIASKLVVDFQPLISRLKEPNKGAVLAVGTLHAGSSENVIPVSAEMSGTIRVFDIEFGRKVVESIKELVRSTCSIYGAEFD